MSSHTSITTWLEKEELPDLYRLLGRPLLDPDIDGLTGILKTAARDLLHYQNHVDPLKAGRAMVLLMELGRVESLLADPERLAAMNQRLVAELSAQCAERFAADGPHWKRQDVREWLERERHISPAALDETLVAVCAALPQPPVIPQPVPMPLRVFGASDDAALADDEIHLGPTLDSVLLDVGRPPAVAPHTAPALERVIMDDSRPPVVAPPMAPCPHCGARVAAGAAICIDCGYDFRSGQRLVAKSGASGEAARRARVRPPPPPRTLRPAPAAKRRKNPGARWPQFVGIACAVALLVVVVGGLALLAIRVRSGEGPSEALATAPPQAGPVEINGSRGTPPDEGRQATQANGNFDDVYRRAAASDPDQLDFDELWETALRLAPNPASRQLVHQTRIAALERLPSPLSADIVEKLCAAYDLYLADAQTVGAQLTIVDALVSALRQKKMLETALSRYVALGDGAVDNDVGKTIVRRLTQECLNDVRTLPAKERMAACQHIVWLADGDESTHLAAYSFLATDPAVIAEVPLENLWKIFDTVLEATPAGLTATGYMRLLVDQIRRRGVGKEAVEHYERLLQQSPKRTFAQAILSELRSMQIAGGGPAGPVAPMGPYGPMGPAGPMMPGGRPAPGGPGTPDGASMPRTPAAFPPAGRSPAGPPQSEPERVDLAAVRQGLKLLNSGPDRMRASEAELEDLYDSIAEQIGRTRDVGDLVGILLDEFERRRRANHVIAHYEQELKQNPDSLPALYFLVGAYQWRSNKGVNARRYNEKRVVLLQHLQTLAPAARDK